MFKKNLKCSSIDESKHYPHKRNIPKTNLICDSQILPTHEDFSSSKMYDCIMKRKDELLSVADPETSRGGANSLIN